MELRGASAGSFNLRWPAIGSARVVDISPNDAAALGADSPSSSRCCLFDRINLARPAWRRTYVLSRPGRHAARRQRAAATQRSTTQRGSAVARRGVSKTGRCAPAGRGSKPSAMRWPPRRRLMPQRGAQCPRCSTPRARFVLDAQGQPLANASFDAAFVNASSTVIGTSTITTDVNGRLEPARCHPPARGCASAYATPRCRCSCITKAPSTINSTSRAR